MNANLDEIPQIIKRLIEISESNDVEAFLECIQLYPDCINGVRRWGGWLRTPLMVAASCGSLEVVQQILTWPQVLVNRQCGPERVTALHCAASSGSPNAAAILRLLLDAGADPYISDKANIKPREAIVMSSLQEPPMVHFLRNMLDPSCDTPEMDEFVLETFKVYECFISEDHNLDLCAYYHIGRGDRRRNPRRHSYRREGCPYFDRFATWSHCPRMDSCEMAHGYFERELHPNVYKTRLCINGVNCIYKASCWNAHSFGELRNKSQAPCTISLVGQGSYPYSYKKAYANLE